VKRLKAQMSTLAEELRRAEEAAARERATPPRTTPVAVIFGDVPITRDELADHLLSRLTAKQLEGYVTRRILEHAGKKEGIVVSNDEVDAHLMEEMARANLQEEAFRARLREQQKSLREWKEDIARPQLLLKKLAASTGVTEKELRHEYEARYGKKVVCQLLVWPAGQREATERAAGQFRTGEATFEEVARKLPRPAQDITISRHGTKERAALEEAAFALAEGEVSPVIDIGQNFILLRCKRRVPADRAVRFEDVRESLKREVADRLKGQDSNRLFDRLKAEARAKLLWAPPEP
jgi:hypothetical protein